MKYFLIILLLCAAGFSLMHNHAYGLWIPQSPDDLLKQSQTIFVGNITSIKVLEFAKSSVYHTEDDGIERQIIENYTLTLDEYTVNVEQFLKNPQNSDTMVVRQPTTSIPGMVVPIGGFEVGDRVLFYVEKIDNENTYSPESFEIPTPCDANVMLSKPRFAFGSDMKMMQNGVQMSDNFTAGMPIKFVYGNDVRTLEGKGFDIDVGINIVIDNKAKPIFREKLRAEAEPCEWIASAEWTITPQAGKHSMAFTVYDDDGDTISHSGSFLVKDDTSYEIDSPLKQFKSGIPTDKIQCKEGLELILKSSDDFPACVSPETKQKLIERGLVKPAAVANESNPKDTEANTVKKLLSENQIEYIPDKIIVASGPLLNGDPRCGAVIDTNSVTHWFAIDSISNPQKMKIFSENPNPCKVNTGSCFCDVQRKLTELTLDRLSYFSPEEEEKTANTLIDYLVKENINKTPKFMIGKFNLNYTDSSAIGYCGELWGYNTIDYFEGAIVNDQVKDYGLTKKPSSLCAISEGAKWWEKK